MRTLLALSCGLTLVGCVRENPDSRLDDDSALDPKERSALLKLDCTQRREELTAARDVDASDFDRVANYKLALKAYTASATRLEAAFSKDPDLLYAAEGDALRIRRDRCQSQARTIGDELRKFELAQSFKPAGAEEKAVVAAPVKASKADEAFAAETKSAPAPVKKISKKSKKAMQAWAKRHAKHGAVLADASN
jgi:hypothetical protein